MERFQPSGVLRFPTKCSVLLVVETAASVFCLTAHMDPKAFEQALVLLNEYRSALFTKWKRWKKVIFTKEGAGFCRKYLRAEYGGALQS